MLKKVSVMGCQKMLLADQKHVLASVAIINKHPDDFLQNIVLVDQTWFHNIVPQQKRKK